MNQSIKSEQTFGSHNLLADLQYCFPTLDTAFYLQDLQEVDTGEIDKALVIFATILVRDWDPLFVGQWLAPVHVDKAYQAASNQKVYLQACERLIDGIRPLLLQGFEGDDPIIDQLYTGAPTETVQRAKLIRRSLRSTSQFKEWIRYRNQTPAEQFLEVLSTIRIQISDDSIKDVPERQKQTVLYGDWYRDQLRLKELSRHFYQYIRSEKTTENLRGVWGALKQVKDIDIDLLLEKKKEFEQVREDLPVWHQDYRKYNISELPLAFPEIYFAGLEGERVITNEVSEYFWGEIFYLLYARKEWAWRAYIILAATLGESLSVEESKNPLSDWNKENTPQVPRETIESSLIDEGICRWKANKIDFAEMFYGLLEAKAIECSNIESGATWLANVFGIDLGRISNMLVPMRDRAKQTAFLDRMTRALKAKIEEDDNRIEERERRYEK